MADKRDIEQGEDPESAIRMAKDLQAKGAETNEAAGQAKEGGSILDKFMREPSEAEAAGFNPQTGDYGDEPDLGGLDTTDPSRVAADYRPTEEAAAKGAVDEAREPEADPVPEVETEAAYNAPPEVYAEYEIPEIDAEAQWVPEVEAEAEWAEPQEADDPADDSSMDPGEPMM